MKGGCKGDIRWCETFTKQVRVRLSINHNMYCMWNWRRGNGRRRGRWRLRWWWWDEKVATSLDLLLESIFIRWELGLSSDIMLIDRCASDIAWHCIYLSPLRLLTQSIWAIDHFNWLCLALDERVPHLLFGRKISIKHVFARRKRTWFIRSNPSDSETWLVAGHAYRAEDGEVRKPPPPANPLDFSSLAAIQDFRISACQPPTPRYSFRLRPYIPFASGKLVSRKTWIV